MTYPDDTTRFLPRAPEQPPCDSRAEDALLSLALIYPHLVAEMDLSADLYFPEHRALWQAMTAVHGREPALNIGDFWLALRGELCAMFCREASGHDRDRSVCAGFRRLQALTLESANPKDRGYWLSRLARCTELRRLISDSAEEAAKAWRMDLEGAQRVVFRSAARARARLNPEVEIPV